MNSVWSASYTPAKFPQLTSKKAADVLIIGGGMAGVLCAAMLQQAGVDYMLVEADTICSGISKNTTAKITAQHGLRYASLVQQFGIEKARLYLQANQAAVAAYRLLSQDIDCDFETKSAFVYALNDRKKLEQELAALSLLGAPAQFCETPMLPFPVAGAIEFRDQAQFHPLKFATSIAENLHIYEHTAVREFYGHTALTDFGTINARKIIVATHFPFLNQHGGYFLKMYQDRSYVLALENAPQLDGMYVDEAENGMSFRNYKNFLLLGGSDHRTGKQGIGWSDLEDFAKNHYPAARCAYRWATQDCMTLDHVPYIGQYAPNTPDLYVATGFNKWGMTSSMVSAMLLTDLVLGKTNPNTAVFSPARTILRPQLAVNAWEAVVDLLTFSKKRCPHLGCALKWNPQERSWDCPCHGSRFTAAGKLIDNPATKNLP